MNKKYLLGTGIVFLLSFSILLFNSFSSTYVFAEKFEVIDDSSNINNTKEEQNKIINKVSNSKNNLKTSKINNKLDKNYSISNDKNFKEKQNENDTIFSETNTKSDNNLTKDEFTLTFYTSLAEENSGYTGLNANGSLLEYGQVANNILPQGTIIKLEDIGVFTVYDKGGDNFNTINRLDVFIPRNDGETDDVYKERVINLGIKKVKGYVLN